MKKTLYSTEFSKPSSFLIVHSWKQQIQDQHHTLGKAFCMVERLFKGEHGEELEMGGLFKSRIINGCLKSMLY